MKEFFPNIDLNFLTLIDLDHDLLIEEIIRGDPISFMVASNAILDERERIVDVDL